MPPLRALLAATVAALVILWTSPARSTSVEQLDRAQVVERAAAILWGDCTSVEAEWDESRTRIFTRVRIVPREVLKGDRQLAALELKLPGGERDGKVYVVHGMPRFQPGQELVLCASAPHPKSGVRVPIGLGQGVWQVERRAGAAGLARRDTRELMLMTPGARGGRSGALEELPLSELLERLRGEVARQAEGGK